MSEGRRCGEKFEIFLKYEAGFQGPAGPLLGVYPQGRKEVRVPLSSWGPCRIVHKGQLMESRSIIYYFIFSILFSGPCVRVFFL